METCLNNNNKKKNMAQLFVIGLATFFPVGYLSFLMAINSYRVK